ncbi:hypothetical protein TNCV_2218301 [Trichonephila clavipes]|nr:hypothetical protein TNCV_2218301 [Trichonephila clavipes]
MNCRDNIVVKVIDSWPACHDFEHSTAEDPPGRGVMHLKRPSVREVWKLGEEGAAQMSYSSIDYSSKLRSPSPKALVLLNSMTLMFTHSLKVWRHV